MLRMFSEIAEYSTSKIVPLALLVFLILSPGIGFGPYGFNSVRFKSSFISQSSPSYVVGWNDEPQTLDFYVYEGGFQFNMTRECDWVEFQTNGHDICVYGYFDVLQNDKYVHFFFTDQVGYNQLEEGQIPEETINKVFSDYSDWNLILPYEFHGRQVSTWYAFVSIAEITDLFMQYRNGTLFIGQDETPPDASIDISDEVSGTASFTVTFHESNCNLSHYEVRAGGELIESDDFGEGQKEATKNFAFDTTEMSEGQCQISVTVNDTGGISETYTASTMVNNIEDSVSTTTQLTTNPEQESQVFNQILNAIFSAFFIMRIAVSNNHQNPFWLFSLFLGACNAIVVWWKAKRENKRPSWFWVLFPIIWVFLSLLVMNIGAIISVFIPSISLLYAGLEEYGKYQSEQESNQSMNEMEARLLKLEDEKDQMKEQFENEKRQMRSEIADLKKTIETDENGEEPNHT